MNSRDLKYFAMEYLRFHKRCIYFCTEFGPHWCDVAGMDKTTFYEIEVKVNKYDFLADFKKEKHRLYKSGLGPNYFYFLVPQYLSGFCKEWLHDEKLPYGLLTPCEKKNKKGIPLRVLHNPSRLHEKKPGAKDIRAMTMRMGSELINTYLSYKEACDMVNRRSEHHNRWENILNNNLERVES